MHLDTIAVQPNLVLSPDFLGLLVGNKYVMSHLIVKVGPVLALPSRVLIQ